MSVSNHETGGLARGVVGRVRVTAFGTSLVATAVSVITVLIVMTSYAGFASPLVVLIKLVRFRQNKGHATQSRVRASEERRPPTGRQRL